MFEASEHPWMAGVGLALALVGSSACTQEQVEDAAKAAANKTAEVASDAAKSAGRAALDGASAAKDWVVEKHTSGELSAATKTALATAGDGIEATILKGKQLAPAGLALAKAAYLAYDKDVDVEAIYQDVEDAEAQAALDEQIQGMPRVETIDGVEVGFSDISSTDASAKVSESAYLVTWRQGDKLVGFIYRSKTTIDIDRLVEVMPTVIEKSKAAL